MYVCMHVCVCVCVCVKAPVLMWYSHKMTWHWVLWCLWSELECRDVTNRCVCVGGGMRGWAHRMLDCSRNVAGILGPWRTQMLGGPGRRGT